MNRDHELLTILMEELAELIVECSKLQRFGFDDLTKFQKELGDVMAMVDLCHEHDLFSWTQVEQHQLEKIEKLKQWSNLFNGS